jgi:hypothetical protein
LNKIKQYKVVLNLYVGFSNTRKLLNLRVLENQSLFHQFMDPSTYHTVGDCTYLCLQQVVPGMVPLRYTSGHVSVRHACPICFGLSPFPITYSPPVSPHTTPSHYHYLATLPRHFPLDIKRRPTQCCPHHYTEFLIHVVLEVGTMVMVGTTVVLPKVAPLSAMIFPWSLLCLLLQVRNL